jgi:hypothetical protein
MLLGEEVPPRYKPDDIHSGLIYLTGIVPEKQKLENIASKVLYLMRSVTFIEAGELL